MPPRRKPSPWSLWLGEHELTWKSLGGPGRTRHGTQMLPLPEPESRVRLRTRRVAGREEEEKGRRDSSEREGRAHRPPCMPALLDHLERMKIVLLSCPMQPGTPGTVRREEGRAFTDGQSSLRDLLPAEMGLFNSPSSSGTPGGE